MPSRRVFQGSEDETISTHAGMWLRDMGRILMVRAFIVL
jgi:hypothetical protein